jgi:hypothetical protein
MTDAIRMRQICLVAPHLAPVVGDIAAIMGLEICYRDPNVARYGLENALLPVDTILLEVVAPFREGTAAGRFIDKTAGRGGYMAILSCPDPRERQANAEKIGVRLLMLSIIRHISASSFIPAIAAPLSSNSNTPPTATIFAALIRRPDLTGTGQSAMM